MDPEDALIEKIQNNLSKNGFPEKVVSFPLSKIQAIVEKDELELDMILSRLSMAGIYSQEQDDKLVFAATPDDFSNQADSSESPSAGDGLGDLLNGLGDLPFNFDPASFAGKSKDDIMSMGKDMMDKMSETDKGELFKKFMSMPAEQKEKLMGKAKDFKLF
ncbi:hypothetical protein PQO03_02615 [Lentisphaera profundi]|uniref:STI1 domain-containing protein n=1 Tax=Lentisphaera profundi TaxID=1658616 RepID=A0ABY7VXQ7_9BACT|nr:hypothetical protein [Lentisphaera profundi]WDE96853.1 hypothetical protein PQO03_02615 [Lentisphaera profundi]